MKNSAVEEIKEKLSIEEVVSSYVKLEKTGINMKGRCPFHNEKTASFFVSPDRGSFYCFGCSKGGDIFTFIEEIEGVDFMGALKILAEKAGVELKFDAEIRKQGLGNGEKEVLYEILEKATLFFEKELNKNEKTKEYLLNRGIDERTQSKFRLGYSKDEWQALYDYLKDEKYSDEQILKTGLVVKNEKGRIYDRFRGRIIFPIFDERGKVIAYSARILTDNKNEPKYINSPETVLFNKSKTLYGLNFAKQTIRKYDFVILMEGQMDIILSHKIGYTNSVASSGTSFTDEQLNIIKRHTDNLLIAFDGDSAGLNSSKKVWSMALQNNMDVKILPLEEGTDPADIILKDSEEWKKLVKNSRHIIEHIALKIKKDFSDTRKQQKEVQKEIYPYIKNIKSFTDKSYFVEKIADMFGINKDAIWSDINNEVNSETEKETKAEKKENINSREVLYGIYLSKELKDKEGFFEKIKEYISEDLILEMNKRKEKIFFETDLLLSQYKNLQKMAEDMYSQLKIFSLGSEKKDLNNKIINMKEGSEEEKKAMKRLVEISREIEIVKKKGCHDLDDMI